MAYQIVVVFYDALVNPKGPSQRPRCRAERATGEEEERSARERKEGVGGPCKFPIEPLGMCTNTELKRVHFSPALIAELRPSSSCPVEACSPDEVCHGGGKRSGGGSSSSGSSSISSRISSSSSIYLRRSTSSPGQCFSAGTCRQNSSPASSSPTSSSPASSSSVSSSPATSSSASSSPASTQCPTQLSHIHDCCTEERRSSQYFFRFIPTPQHGFNIQFCHCCFLLSSLDNASQRNPP